VSPSRLCVHTNHRSLKSSVGCECFQRVSPQPLLSPVFHTPAAQATCKHAHTHANPLTASHSPLDTPPCVRRQLSQRDENIRRNQERMHALNVVTLAAAVAPAPPARAASSRGLAAGARRTKQKAEPGESRRSARVRVSSPQPQPAQRTVPPRTPLGTLVSVCVGLARCRLGATGSGY
jgi:hypothetical protein